MHGLPEASYEAAACYLPYKQLKIWEETETINEQGK